MTAGDPNGAGGNSSGEHKRGSLKGELHLCHFSFEVLLKVYFCFPISCFTVMYQTGEIVGGFDAQNAECTIIYAWNYAFLPLVGTAT